MQVSIETTSTLERRLTIGVPAERVEKEVDSPFATRCPERASARVSSRQGADEGRAPALWRRRSPGSAGRSAEPVVYGSRAAGKAEAGRTSFDRAEVAGRGQGSRIRRHF